MSRLARRILLLCALVAVPDAASAQAFDGLAVIANVDGLAALTRRDVNQLMRGERALWANGTAVTVVLPSARSPFIDQVARQVFGTSRAGMQRYWLSLVFQGRAAAPTQLESARDMAQFVRRTPGAIAVLALPVPDEARALVIEVR